MIRMIDYMSPDQILEEKLDSRTDLFSLGLVLYEMATGQKAFPGESADSVKEAILYRTPIPARDLNQNIPPKFVDIIDKCTQKNRALRYQQASEILEQFERLTRKRPRRR